MHIKHQQLLLMRYDARRRVLIATTTTTVKIRIFHNVSLVVYCYCEQVSANFVVQ